MEIGLKKKGWEKVFFVLSLVIGFGLIFIYNVLTPLMSDDLLFDPSAYQTAGDLFRAEYEKYMTWNGRSVLQMIMAIFYLLPKSVFNIVNSLCFLYTSLLIYWNIEGRKKWDCTLFLLIQLLLWNFSVDFDQTVLWVGGACNYLWGIMIILSFITFYRYLQKKQQIGRRITLADLVLLFVIAFLAGWGNENTSGGAILILGLLTINHIRKQKRIEGWMLVGLLSSLLGFAFLLLAPGNRVRGDLLKAEETYQGAAALVSRGLKVIQAIDEHLLIYLVVICVLGVYFYQSGRKLAEFQQETMFTIGALATAAVLIFTPEPMPRAYYGANIYMMIGALNLLWKLRQEDGLLYPLRTGGILAGVLAFAFIYIEEGANLARILREVRERETYIMEEKAKGKRELTLPMLRPAFETPYSYLYENDLSKEEEYWINKVYCIAYDLDHIQVLSREEWDAWRQ